MCCIYVTIACSYVLQSSPQKQALGGEGGGAEGGGEGGEGDSFDEYSDMMQVCVCARARAFVCVYVCI